MFDKVKEIIVDTLDCNADDVTMEASLTETLGADSLDAVELQLAWRIPWAFPSPMTLSPR